jgi:hypothetical protein
MRHRKSGTMMGSEWQLEPNRFFDPDPKQRRVARGLYKAVVGPPRIALIRAV